jgi:hypothetical protein
MRNVSDKEREKLSAEIAGLESLESVESPVEASLRNRSTPTSESGLAQAGGCIPYAGECAWWSKNR